MLFGAVVKAIEVGLELVRRGRVDVHHVPRRIVGVADIAGDRRVERHVPRFIVSAVIGRCEVVVAADEEQLHPRVLPHRRGQIDAGVGDRLIALFGLVGEPPFVADAAVIVDAVAQFFFSSRRRHTRWTGDWSSDVCSSDLGFTVKFWHIAGVKSLKGAIFENQPFVNAASDTRFDEVVRAAMDSGWQPLVQSWDRHSGERTYIYAQDLGKDMKVLVVNLESNEAVVLQVKVDPKKLNDFIEETNAGHHRNRPTPREETAPQSENRVELAAATSPDWDGICLFAQDRKSVV